MSFGDELKKNIDLLKKATGNKLSEISFWVILRDIAVKDILDIYPSKVDSDIAVAVYYEILLENIDKIPDYYKSKLKSNNQYRFRVINRNMWTSNAFHVDGLANQPNIRAKKIINPDRKGNKIVYEGEPAREKD